MKMIYIYIYIYIQVSHKSKMDVSLSQKQDGRNIYVIMKTLCTPGYHHYLFVYILYIYKQIVMSTCLR